MRVFLMDSSSLSRNPSFTEWILCSSYILFFSSYHDILSLTDFINYLFTELIQMPTLMQVFRVKLWWNTIWVVVFWTDGSSENIESSMYLILLVFSSRCSFLVLSSLLLFFFFFCLGLTHVWMRIVASTYQMPHSFEIKLVMFISCHPSF